MMVRPAVVMLLIAGCSEKITPTTGSLAVGGRTAEVADAAKPLARDFSVDVPDAYFDLSRTFTIRTGGFTPPVQARAYGYMGLALYEAVVGGMPDHRSIASQLHSIGPLPQPEGIPYRWPLVANAAMAEVMRGLWGDKTDHAAQNIADLDALEAKFVSQYGAGAPPGIAKLSIDFGHVVGAAIYAASLSDGENESYLTNFPSTYVPPVGPGFWVPTAPGQVALQPFWAATMRPLVLATADACDPGPPPSYSEQSASPFYGEAKLDYDISKTLTPEQLTIARYWADGAGTFSGPGHSMAIVAEVLTQHGGTLADAAEAYARAGIANADALTAIWSAKFRYNLIRPVTYIRRVIDPAWNTALPTPAFPEYVSAHSGQSAASLATLEALVGTNVPFVDHAHDADGFEPRSFDHIFAAAEEAGMSRVYAGIHFMSGNLNGRALGKCVAATVDALSWRR